jgi:hypothetical protein
LLGQILLLVNFCTLRFRMLAKIQNHEKLLRKNEMGMMNWYPLYRVKNYFLN